MKSRISILMFLGCLFFWSCQKENTTLPESPQMDDNEEIVNVRDGQPVIFVHWGNDAADPVHGARVFNMETNELIAETDGEGNAYIEPVPGIYRVVDPEYGQQQAIVKYPDNFKYDRKTGTEREVIGWTINGDPVYGDDG